MLILPGAVVSDVLQKLPADATNLGISASYRELLVSISCVTWALLCLPLLHRSRSMSVRKNVSRGRSPWEAE